MLYPKLVNNLTCGSIPSLLSNINCRLTIMANALYNNTIYMMNKKDSAGDMLILLNYKRILTIKHTDPTYCEHITIQMIASRVKILTLNCKPKCFDKQKPRPVPTYISFFGRVGPADCLDGFKTVIAGSTDELYKSTEVFALGTIISHIDKTPLGSSFLLDFSNGKLLTTNSSGVVILVEDSNTVPC